MSKWVAISTKVPEEKYEEYKKFLDVAKGRISRRNYKGEFTMSVFISFCIDKVIDYMKKSETK